MFGRRVQSPAIELDNLIAKFGQAAGLWESQPKSEVLVRARLADACRDLKIRPVLESQFEACWSRLDEIQRLRFCILVDGLETAELATSVQKLCSSGGHAEPVLTLLQRLTVRLQFLTGSVLQQSDIRLEEFSRHFCAAWGLGIQGEDPAASSARLHAIDFGRLMQEADTARASAEERLAYLRKLQAEQEKTRRPRRGKW